MDLQAHLAPSGYLKIPSVSIVFLHVAFYALVFSLRDRSLHLKLSVSGKVSSDEFQQVPVISNKL